jgi:uncharacterized membrane protein YfcA
VILGVAGLVIGLINGMAGGATIIAYSLLSAFGLNPVSAATTTALGAISANFMAIRHHRDSFRTLFVANRKLIFASIIGTLIGAYFLLTMPMYALQRLSPFLVLVASLTLLIPPPGDEKQMSERTETLAIFGTGLYCGYFGPGQGVMVSATLARDPQRAPSLLNATKNVIVGWTVVASNIIFTFSGYVHWVYAGILALCTGIGGHFGGKFATTMSLNFYRKLILSVGLISTLWLFTKYY